MICPIMSRPATAAQDAETPFCFPCQVHDCALYYQRREQCSYLTANLGTPYEDIAEGNDDTTAATRGQ